MLGMLRRGTYFNSLHPPPPFPLLYHPALLIVSSFSLSSSSSSSYSYFSFSSSFSYSFSYPFLSVRRVPNEMPIKAEAEQSKETKAMALESKNTKTASPKQSKTDNENDSPKVASPRASESARSTPRTPATFESRLRASLFANVNRSIDELYQLCEEECDAQMCLDAVTIFERSGRDFRLLTDRIDDMAQYGLDRKGVAWEVRLFRINVNMGIRNVL